MVDQWTDAWEEALAAVPKSKLEIVTIEMLHPAFIEEGEVVSVRAANNTEDLELPLEAEAPLDAGEVVTFKGIPFEMPWPEIEDARVPSITIKVDGIGREVTPYLDDAVQIQAAITVILRTYIIDKDTGVAAAAHDPITFQMRQVTVTDSAVQGMASPRDLANKRAVAYVYNLQEYPGLNAV